jgi:hypothetical protein
MNMEAISAVQSSVMQSVSNVAVRSQKAPVLPFGTIACSSRATVNSPDVSGKAMLHNILLFDDDFFLICVIQREQCNRHLHGAYLYFVNKGHLSYSFAFARSTNLFLLSWWMLQDQRVLISACDALLVDRHVWVLLGALFRPTSDPAVFCFVQFLERL